MEWISVKDNMPEEEATVLISDGINISTGYWTYEDGINMGGYEPYPDSYNRYEPMECPEWWDDSRGIIKTAIGGQPEPTHWATYPKLPNQEDGE